MSYIPQFENIHCHTYMSNVFTKGSFPDSPCSISDYAKVYSQRGQQCLIITQHGVRSDFYQQADVASKYDGMKAICGAEFYFCTDRRKDPETNKPLDPRTLHLLVIARNEDGIKELNYAMSLAYTTGFHYVGRVDFDILRNINPKNVIVTTACVGGVLSIQKAEDYQDILKRLHSMFGESLYLEVQPHSNPKQVQHNKRVLELYRKHGIKLILGLDTHYVNKQDKYLRQELIASKGRTISDSDDDSWDLYLPTPQQAYDMMVAQGVLSKSQIQEAFQNTLITREFQGFTYKQQRKFPIAKKYRGMTQEQRESAYRHLVADEYIKHFGMPSQEQAKQLKEEMRTIISTHSCDYFLGLKEMLDRGIQLGGVITKTGRGSASSFATNAALGFTTVNRMHAPVKLFPSRFISEAKLRAGSMPDIDSNLSNVQAFENAGKEVFGEWGCIPAIAYGKLQTLNAFKMLARAKNIQPQLANDISKQIAVYQRQVKLAKQRNADDPDYNVDYDVAIQDYVDSKYIPVIDASKQYMGIVVSASPHPCAHITYHEDLRKQIGVVRLKDNIVLLIDGTTADAVGYVKSDLLRVDVVKIINEAFNKAGEEVFSADELIEHTKNDNRIWRLFDRGVTCGLNQTEQEKSTQRIMTLKPRNVVQLAAFVAAIRPGARSMVDDFINRRPHSYGIPAMDKLTRLDGATGITGQSSYVFYDQQIMTLAQAAGMDPADAQLLCKAIKKKKFDKVQHYKQEFVPGFKNYLINTQHCSEQLAESTTESVWTVIINSAQYLFNASHALCMALDCLYGAYLKVNYPYEFYYSLLKNYDDKGNKQRVAKIAVEMKKHFGIAMTPGRFGQNNTDWFIDKDNCTISQSLSSIKFISKQCAADLAKMKPQDYPTFVDVLHYIFNNTSINLRQVVVLICSGYFERYGGQVKLYKILQEYKSGKNRITKTLSQKSVNIRLPQLKALEAGSADCSMTTPQRCMFEYEYMCMCMSTQNFGNYYYVQQVDTQYGIKATLYNMSTGSTGKLKISKSAYEANEIYPKSIIKITNWQKKPRYSYKDGNRTKIQGAFDNYLISWQNIQTKQCQIPAINEIRSNNNG